MFMIVTYPWPAAAAHVELTGPQRPGAPQRDPGAAENSTDQRLSHIDEMIEWSGRERLLFHWCRLRMAINDLGRRSVMGQRPIAGG